MKKLKLLLVIGLVAIICISFIYNNGTDMAPLDKYDDRTNYQENLA